MSFPNLSEVMSAVTENIGNPMDAAIGSEAPAPASTSSEAPSASEAPESSASAPAPTAQEQAVLDLKELIQDKKFKLDDKEYSYEDLKKSVMRWKDYTQKTQEISGFKKEYESLKSDSQYWSALPGDVDRVKNDPSLAAKFKEVYPEKYHHYVTQFETEQPLTEDRIRRIVQESINPVVKPLQESITEQNSKAIVAQFEAWDSELKSKYKEADIKHVYTILEEAKANKIPVNKDLWEHAWKQSHDYFDSIIKTKMSERFKEKQTTNQAGKDTRAGGATPGQAPEKIALKDSHKHMLEALMSAQS